MSRYPYISENKESNLWLGEMRVHSRFHRDVRGVSEVVGAMLLILIAIIAFAAIYNYVFPLRLPSAEPNVKLMGYVTTDIAGNPVVVLEHMGGEQLVSYKILVGQSDGTHTYSYENRPWSIGDCYNPPFDPVLFDEEHVVRVTVVDVKNDGSEEVIFQGTLTPESKPEGTEQPSEPGLPTDPTLVSTLRTDTGDEDLLCYNYSVNTTIHPTTYIYNWLTKTGDISTPYARFLMPFDTNNPTLSKDYSGNGYNGTVSGASWTNQGKVGGAYSFNGQNSITIPYCFQGAYLNQLTVETWIKTSQSSGTILSFDRSKYWSLL